MEFKKLAAVATLVGSAAIMSAPVQAEILDAWQLNLPGYAGVSNIGHLVVSGGETTVTQQLNAAGEIEVGSKFTNFGGLYSITYTPESCVGGCDSGVPSVLPVVIEYNFSGLTGTVTGYDSTTGAVEYVFDAGVGVAELTMHGDSNVLATFTPVDPSGGSLGNFHGGVNTSGTSNLLFALTSVSDDSLFQDKDGENVLPGNVFFAIDTTNQIFDPASAPAACDTFGVGGFCSQLVVTQQGKIDALRSSSEIPEPATLALLALGILGMGTVARRKN